MAVMTHHIPSTTSALLVNNSLKARPKSSLPLLTQAKQILSPMGYYIHDCAGLKAAIKLTDARSKWPNGHQTVLSTLL